MRALDCECGQHFEAPSDAELVPIMQEHLEKVHPDVQLNDEEKRELYLKMVHDV